MVAWLYLGYFKLGWACPFEKYSIKVASPTQMSWRWKIFEKRPTQRPEEQKQMMLTGETQYQAITRENSPCPSLSDVVDATQTIKLKSCSYLPGMPVWFIKYLWGTEGAKQKEGTAFSQASRVGHVREKSVSQTWKNFKINESVKEEK